MTRLFYWTAENDNGGTPPPAIIAAAVERQSEWRNIVAVWPRLSRRFEAELPDQHGTVPVRFDPELPAKIDAAERAAIEQTMAASFAEQDEQERREADQAARWFAETGLAALIAAMRVPFALTPMNMPALFKARIAERVETGRTGAVDQLALRRVGPAGEAHRPR